MRLFRSGTVCFFGGEVGEGWSKCENRPRILELCLPSYLSGPLPSSPTRVLDQELVSTGFRGQGGGGQEVGKALGCFP